MWQVYILQCQNGALYTGVTNDLKRRVDAHRKGSGSKYTRSFGVKKIMYIEKQNSQSQALKRETEIKKLSRPNKLKLIRKKAHNKI